MTERAPRPGPERPRPAQRGGPGAGGGGGGAGGRASPAGPPRGSPPPARPAGGSCTAPGTPASPPAPLHARFGSRLSRGTPSWGDTGRTPPGASGTPKLGARGGHKQRRFRDPRDPVWEWRWRALPGAGLCPPASLSSPGLPPLPTAQGSPPVFPPPPRSVMPSCLPPPVGTGIAYLGKPEPRRAARRAEPCGSRCGSPALPRAALPGAR